MSSYSFAHRQPLQTAATRAHLWPWLPVLVAAAGLSGLLLAASFLIH